MLYHQHGKREVVSYFKECSENGDGDCLNTISIFDMSEKDLYRNLYTLTNEIRDFGQRITNSN